MAGTNVSGIYLITVLRPNKPSKFYVGSSSNISNRWRRHLSGLRAGFHFNLPLQAAWNKYGADAFSFSIVESAPASDLIVREQIVLDLFRGERGDAHCLNIKKQCVKSRLGIKESAETREKLKPIRRKKWQDPSFREKTVAAIRLAVQSEDHRANLRAIQLEVQNRPDILRHQRAVQKVAQNRPDVKLKKSSSIRAALASDESKQRRRETNALPEVKARRSAAAKKWQMERGAANGH